MDGPPTESPRDDRRQTGRETDPGHDDDGREAAPPPSPEQQRKSRLRKRIGIFLGLAVLAALIVAGVLYWLHARHFEDTDDAFIDGHTTQMASQVSGRVTRLLIDDNQHVTAGQKLLLIDPRDYQVKLDQSRAQLANVRAQLQQTQAQLGVQQASVDQAVANVRVTEADLTQAQQDFARYRNIDPKAIAKQQLDSSSATLKSAEAKLDANRRAVEGARAQIAATAAQVQATAAQVRAAEADVADAELQLSYTTLAAPADGRVTKRSVEVGNYVSPGQSLLAIVQDQLWVTANFKETQLADMKPGQHVDISVDAFPGVTFSGRVESFQEGTGSVFSSLPAENATGNYVKVVQRLPVKILFDDDRAGDYRLAPGLSVEPRVTVR